MLLAVSCSKLTKTCSKPEDPVGVHRPDDTPNTTGRGPLRPGEIIAPPQAGPANPTATKKEVITDTPDSPVTNVPNFPTPIVTLPGAGPIAIDPTKSVIVIGDKTSAFTPGQQTTVNNVPISFDSSAGFVVVGGTKTIGLPPITPAPVAPPAVIGGTTIDVDQIATQLQPGQVTTIGRNTISRDSSGSFLVIDGTSTVALPQGASIPRTSMVEVNGIAIPIGELAEELSPGETTVIGSMTISRDNSGLIIGTSTIPLPTTTDRIVLGGTTISAGTLPSGFSFLPSSAGGGLLLPNGETLMPGSETTINGMEISLMPGATPVAVIEDSISVTATTTSDSSTRGDDTCTGGSTCTQPSKTSAGQTGSKTPASSAEELACGKWRDFVFAGIFVGVFMDWA